MLEMTVLVAVAGVWSAVRVVRCERCGVPMGLLEVLVRSLTFSERCSACRRLERAREPRFTTRLSSDPELGLRAAEIRYALAEMVRRQREELHEAQRALTDESVGSSRSGYEVVRRRGSMSRRSRRRAARARPRPAPAA